MKYVFFGTPRFAEIILRNLITAGMAPTALVCNPDRPVGRKKTITAPPTKLFVLENKYLDIKILQPEKFDDSFLEKLKSFGSDCFVVAAYAKILPHAVTTIPRLGTLGVHPSLLPKYRGASPIQSVILSGEKETGVTIYKIDDKMDHGPVIVKSRVSLTADKSYIELEEELARLSAETLIKALPEFLAQKIVPHAQDETSATYTKKFTTQDGFVDEADLEKARAGDAERALLIGRKIRALNPEPGCWTKKNGTRMKLLNANWSGTRLVLTEVQNEGERPKKI
jgi:methionyl-tRNA formyltransferase